MTIRHALTVFVLRLVHAHRERRARARWQRLAVELAAPLPLGWRRNGATNCMHVPTGAQVWRRPGGEWCYQRHCTRAITPDGRAPTRTAAMRAVLRVQP